MARYLPVNRSQGSGHRPFDVPTELEAFANRALRKSHDFRPLGEGFGLTTELYQSIRSPIQRLLGACRPSAIIRRIAEMIFDAVDAVVDARSWTHVGVEPFKARQPIFTDGDATPAVAFKFWPATFLDADPYFVFRCLGQAMRFITRNHHFSVQASATLSVSGAQGSGVNRDIAATEASTLPFSFFAMLGQFLDDGESSKRQTSKVHIAAISDSHGRYYATI